MMRKGAHIGTCQISPGPGDCKLTSSESSEVSSYNFHKFWAALIKIAGRETLIIIWHG